MLRLMVDEEFLPFAQNSFDLVVSSLRCVHGSEIGHFTAIDEFKRGWI